MFRKAKVFCQNEEHVNNPRFPCSPFNEILLQIFHRNRDKNLANDVVNRCHAYDDDDDDDLE